MVGNIMPILYTNALHYVENCLDPKFRTQNNAKRRSEQRGTNPKVLGERGFDCERLPSSLYNWRNFDVTSCLPRHSQAKGLTTTGGLCF